jgi:hypothetical protein
MAAFGVGVQNPFDLLNDDADAVNTDALIAAQKKSKEKAKAVAAAPAPVAAAPAATAAAPAQNRDRPAQNRGTSLLRMLRRCCCLGPGLMMDAMMPCSPPPCM